MGGLVLGGLLLALPQLYGVGYPVMNNAVAGRYVLWFLVLLLLAKMVAAGLTIGIGGSGGVFAPSLFIGAMAGTAFGVTAQHLFGSAVGDPAIYGVMAMGAVFAAAAQAPLTAIASVVEMTGNWGLTLPVMLAVALAVGVSKRLTYGTIYTTKLLRRGTDIDRPKPATVLQTLTVADIMQPLAAPSSPSSDRQRGRSKLPSRTGPPVSATSSIAAEPKRSAPTKPSSRPSASSSSSDPTAYRYYRLSENAWSAGSPKPTCSKSWPTGSPTPAATPPKARWPPSSPPPTPASSSTPHHPRWAATS